MIPRRSRAGTAWLILMAVAVGALAAQAWAAQGSPLTFSFRNIAREAGLTAVTIFGGTETNKYLLETTGCGVAALDYDDDGWLDVFVVNGTVL
jgi:hypothetical protein